MKRKTCASVLALILTCAMVTGSLPVEANAAEAAAASPSTDKVPIQSKAQKCQQVEAQNSVSSKQT